MEFNVNLENDYTLVPHRAGKTPDRQFKLFFLLLLSAFALLFSSCDGVLFGSSDEDVLIRTYDTTEEEIVKDVELNPDYGCIIFKAPEDSPIEMSLFFELSIDINGTTYTETLSQGQVVVINNIPAGKIYPVKCTAMTPDGGVFAAGSTEAKMTAGKISTLDLVMRTLDAGSEPDPEPVIFHGTPYTVVGGNGTAGNGSTYVIFGDWPQSIKADGIIVYEEKSVQVGNLTYYRGNDDAWYARSGGNYYKVEPIKWRVLDDSYNGKKLLLAVKVLAGHRYDDDSNNYMNSEIRDWLNGYFYNTAFADDIKSHVVNTTVDNSAQSTTDSNGSLYTSSYYCADTQDYVFLLSEKEVTNTGYGFAGYQNETSGNTRIRTATDFARANGATPYDDGYYWWLRSPGLGSDTARAISTAGSADFTIDYTDGGVGVVPALCVD